MSSQAVPRFLEDKLVSNQTFVNNGMSRNAPALLNSHPACAAKDFWGDVWFLLGVHIRCMTAAWRSHFHMLQREFSIMKLISSCGNEDAFAQSSTNLILVASFFHASSGHITIYIPQVLVKSQAMGLHNLQPTNPEATLPPQRDFIRNSHQEFFYTPTFIPFMNHSSRFHLPKITSFRFFRFWPPCSSSGVPTFC